MKRTSAIIIIFLIILISSCSPDKCKCYNGKHVLNLRQGATKCQEYYFEHQKQCDELLREVGDVSIECVSKESCR